MTDILITSSVLIGIVFAARLAFRRTLSCRIRYALWGLVALRLLLPVQLPAADFSVLNGARTVQTQIVRFTDAPIFPTAPETAPAPSDAEPVPTKAPVRTLTASEWLNVIWITGMAVTGGTFLLSNLRFRRFLYGKRKLYDNVSASRAVYLVENGLPSPCLFGLLRPSIYVTPAAVADPQRLRHVIAHEETHARHCDTLWSLLRCVCLTVYWFDPLVWAAAFASKADCELACDEGTLARLGETARIAYGETLLSLIPARRGNPFLTATTMTAGKRQLRDRISRIAKRPRQFAAIALCVVLLAAFACACTFTGKSRDGNAEKQMEMYKALADSSDGVRWQIVSEHDLGGYVVCGLSGSENQAAIAVFKRVGDKSDDMRYTLQSLVTGEDGEIIACVLDEPYPAECAWLCDTSADYAEIVFSNDDGEDKASIKVEWESSERPQLIVAKIPYESCSVHIAYYGEDGTLLQSRDYPSIITQTAKDKGENVLTLYSSEGKTVPARIETDYLREIPDTYQEIIKRDDLVIQDQNGTLLNRQLFDDFLHSVEQGQNAEVIIVQFTVEGDPCLGCLQFDGDRFFYLRDDSRDKFAGEIKYWIDSYLYFQQINGNGLTLHILTDTEFADYGEYDAYMEQHNGDSVKLPQCVLYLPTGENIKWQDGNAVAEASKILLRAFSYHANAISDISHENTQGRESVTVTFRDNETASDIYTVTFADGVPYPVTAYHFNAYADAEEIDIGSDANFSYNPDMTQAAKDFVKTVCGADCSAAAVSAYGYKNKVCVALERSENEVFLVSFHYKNLNPVGIRIALDKSLVGKSMELEKARLLYP